VIGEASLSPGQGFFIHFIYRSVRKGQKSMSSKPAAVRIEQRNENSKTVKPKTKLCYVCGPDNPNGLQVPFSPDGPQGSRALYTGRAEHGGWPGILHGGVTFALMDEALGWAVHFQGLHGVTAKAETRFREPVRVGEKVVIRAWTIEQRRRLMTARAEVRSDDDNGVLLAETDATMYLMDAEQE
jgi:acyl-coenzyme A thioesterase PaaI-like protein